MNKPGMMLVMSAPSGTGKSTLVRRLVKEFPSFAFSISCTTRAPRPGEVNGREYHFLSKDDFLARREQNFFAEWAEVHGNFYGTPHQTTEDLLAQGRDVLFDIDVQGARQLKANMQRGTYVFLFPPSREILTKRLTGRGTDDQATVAKRLANAAREIADSSWFDHWIVNDVLDQAYDQLRAICVAEKLRPTYHADWQEHLNAEWNLS